MSTVAAAVTVAVSVGFREVAVREMDANLPAWLDCSSPTAESREEVNMEEEEDDEDRRGGKYYIRCVVLLAT